MNAEVSYKFKKKDRSRGVIGMFSLMGSMIIFFTLLLSLPDIITTWVFAVFLLSFIGGTYLISKWILVIADLKLSFNKLTYELNGKRIFSLKLSDISTYSFDNVLTNRQLILTSINGEKYKIAQDKVIKNYQGLEKFEVDFIKLVNVYNTNHTHQIKIGRSVYQSSFMRLWAVSIIILVVYGIYFVIFEKVQDEGAVFSLVGYLFIIIPMLIIFFKKNFSRRGSADEE